MNCEDFRGELETAVENRAAPDVSGVRDHLKHCRHCRVLWEDYDILERAVAEWTAVDDEAPDLSGRVLAVLANDREPSRASQSGTSPSRIVPVLAGLSVVAVLFLVFVLNRGPDQNAENVAKTPSESEDEVNIESEPVEMDRVVSDTQAAYESLVKQVTGPFEPFTDDVAPAIPGDEKTGSPGEIREKSPNSVSPQLAGLQSEVMKPLGFLTAVFPSPSPQP